MEIQISLVKTLWAQMFTEQEKRMSYWKKRCKSKVILICLIGYLRVIVQTCGCSFWLCPNTECELLITKSLVRIRPWIETSENCNDLMDVCCLTSSRWVVSVWIWVDHNNCCDIFTPIGRLRNEAKHWEMWSVFSETADVRIRKEAQE